MMKRWHIWVCLLLVVGAALLAGQLIADEIPVAHWDWPEDRVEIPPYLLELDPDSAVLCWVTPVESQGVVELRSLFGVHEERESSPTRYHKVKLQDLRPSTFYRYEINGLYQGEFSTPAMDKTFRAVVVGHTHGTEARLHYPDELSVAKIVDLAPDLVLHCGDTTYHATIEEFRRFFFQLFRPALTRFPVYVAPGNHDSGWPGVYGISFDNFRRLHPREYGGDQGGYYTFEYKHVRFFALSYTTLGFGKDSKQYEWLAQELGKSTSEFNVVFLGAGHKLNELNQELFDILSDYEVALVLGGDSAGSFNKELNGIPYFFTGTAFGNPHPLRLIEFSDYSLTVRAFDAMGKMKPTLHTVNTKRPKVKVLDLSDTTKHSAVFKNERIESLNLQGFNSGERITFPDVTSTRALLTASFLRRVVGVPRMACSVCTGDRRRWLQRDRSSRKVTNSGIAFSR